MRSGVLLLVTSCGRASSNLSTVHGECWSSVHCGWCGALNDGVLLQSVSLISVRSTLLKFLSNSANKRLKVLILLMLMPLLLPQLLILLLLPLL